MRDRAVRGLARRNHQKDAARLLERLHQVRRRRDADDVLALGSTFDEGARFFGVQIVARNRKAVALEVESEIVAHHTQADDAYFALHGDALLL